jgi:hypothetical protein
MNGKLICIGLLASGISCRDSSIKAIDSPLSVNEDGGAGGGACGDKWLKDSDLCAASNDVLLSTCGSETTNWDVYVNDCWLSDHIEGSAASISAWGGPTPGHVDFCLSTHPDHCLFYQVSSHPCARGPWWKNGNPDDGPDEFVILNGKLGPQDCICFSVGQSNSLYVSDDPCPEPPSPTPSPSSAS